MEEKVKERKRDSDREKEIWKERNTESERKKISNWVKKEQG